MKKKRICEHCNKDLDEPGFECTANICPTLDVFTKVEPANQAPRIRTSKPARHKKASTKGGPAPSDTPTRIRYKP